jgi:hypothetical protein
LTSHPFGGYPPPSILFCIAIFRLRCNKKFPQNHIVNVTLSCYTSGMKKNGIENKPYIEGMRQIRQSNAAGLHLDKRYKRNRTRDAQLRTSLKDGE